MDVYLPDIPLDALCSNKHVVAANKGSQPAVRVKRSIRRPAGTHSVRGRREATLCWKKFGRRGKFMLVQIDRRPWLPW